MQFSQQTRHFHRDINGIRKTKDFARGRSDVIGMFFILTGPDFNSSGKTVGGDCLFPERFLEEDSIEIPDVNLRESAIRVFHELSQMQHRHVVRLHLDVVAERVIPAHLPMEEQQLGFAISESVPFDMVRMVVPLQLQLSPEARLILGTERLQRNPLGIKTGQIFKLIHATFESESSTEKRAGFVALLFSLFTPTG